MPAPAITATAIRGMNAAREAAGALQEERALARKAKTISQAMKVKSELKSKVESVERLAKKLKQLKRIGWLIKGVTLGTTSIGDVFVSLWILLLWSNVELIIFPIILPWWKQELWEKVFTIILDIVVLAVILMIFAILASIVS